MPTGLTLQQAKQLCYDLDKQQNRQWQIYVNNTLLLQVNPNSSPVPPEDPLSRPNPRIRQLPVEEVREFSDLTDKLIIYEVRIIKDDSLIPLIGKTNEYKLSFNQGQTKQTYQVVDIKESTFQGLFWALILAR
jgi:hypothetical protein